MRTTEPDGALPCSCKNGMGTSIAIVEALSGFSRGKKRMMERETVKEIFRRFNAGGIRYALIGGLAHAQYAPPRATQDIDFLVLAEDVGKVGQLFPGCYLRGTAIAGIYELEGTRFDVQPASLRAQIGVVTNAVDDRYEGEPIKVASVRDLILLKLAESSKLKAQSRVEPCPTEKGNSYAIKVWAAAERPEPAKRMRDQADVVELLAHNADEITADDVAYIGASLLSLGFTAEETAKAQRSIVWLNRMLDDLGLSDRKHP